MTDRLDLLLPPPLAARETGSDLALDRGVAIAVRAPGAGPARDAERLAAALADAGVRATIVEGRPLAPGAPRIVLRLDAEEARPDPQAYRLRIDRSGAEVAGGGEPGLSYGVATLLQWLAVAHAETDGPPRRLPGLEVDDAPGLPVRGVLLDVSRNKVPRLESLFELVDRLAGWKINELQLYTEHTFAYRGHEKVWRGWSPLTPDNVRRLDRHCAERHVELVPNQNSFGHLHRWLRHEPYRRLAECPEGVEHAFGDEVEPFSLCPLDAGSLDLLADLYDQLLPCFASRQVNVGLDETFDLGLGRSAEAVAERGRGRVYLDFLLAVHRLVAERGHRMQFWGDVVLEHRELVGELPDDAVALAWGYEAGHPFDDQLARFAAAGLETRVCPGTSGWISFAGRTTNAITNVAEAARAAAAHGAAGLLVTDWGDHGHLQPPPASALGLAAAAGFGWRPEAADRPQAVPFERLVELHAWRAPGSGLGRAARLLGDAYLAPRVRLVNGSVLAHLLLFPERRLDAEPYRDLTGAGLERARDELAAAAPLLAGADTGGAEAERVRRELDWARRTLELACDLGLARLDRGGAASAADLPRPLRRDLARRLAGLVEELRPLWRERFREGGLEASATRMGRVGRLMESQNQP